MHQKISEIQIGKESTGISSDYNHPTLSPSITHKHPNPNPNFNFSSNPLPLFRNNETPSSYNPPLMTPPPSTPTVFQFSNFKFGALRLIRCVRRLRVHIRFVLVLVLPLFYYLSGWFILDFLSAFAFSLALLLSINLALPRLPSIRVFLNRPSDKKSIPVVWSIGSGSKTEKNVVLTSSGCWVEAYSNGDVYEGEFHKGKCSGSGVYYYCYLNGRYEGDWVDGKYDGYGVESWGRGSRFRGQFRKGLRHGFGVYRFYTGDAYAGEWSNGQCHGCGILTCQDGSRYVGQFKSGLKHGLGHYHFRNGDVYAGEYFADKMHGYGAYKFRNGHRYEGGWHEGRRQGLGMYTFRNGETKAGQWHNGVLNVPTTQHPTHPISHSKLLIAVQEARQAAEKANDVGKVDERVNRAMTAANRAATAGRVAAVKAVQNPKPNHDCLPFHFV